MTREDRLAAIEVRAQARVKRRSALLAIAVAILNGKRQAEYAVLVREAKETARRLFVARVEAGTQRWATCRDHGAECPNLRTLGLV